VRRAVDVENHRLSLKKKVKDIDSIQFDCDDNVENIKRKTVSKIIESLEILIHELPIKTIEPVSEPTKDVLKQKVTENLEDLKDPLKAVVTIKEILELEIDKLVEKKVKKMILKKERHF